MKTYLKSKKEKGASFVEYCVLLGLISVVVIYSVFQMGGEVKDNFNDISETLVNTEITGNLETPSSTPENPPEITGVVFNNPATYPDPSECGNVSANGSFTPGLECYIGSSQEATGTTDLTGTTEETTVYFNSTSDPNTMGPIIEALGPGITYIVENFVPRQTYFVVGNESNHNLSLMNVSCTDLYFSTQMLGPFRMVEIDYNDPVSGNWGKVAVSEGVNNIYCDGDGETMPFEEIAAYGGGYGSEYYVSNGYLEHNTDNIGTVFVGSTEADALPSPLTWVYVEPADDTCIYDPAGYQYIYCESDWRSQFYVLDGYLEHQTQNIGSVFVNSEPSDPLPAPLYWRIENGDRCIYDPTTYDTVFCQS